MLLGHLPYVASWAGDNIHTGFKPIAENLENKHYLLEIVHGAHLQRQKKETISYPVVIDCHDEPFCWNPT